MWLNIHIFPRILRCTRSLPNVVIFGHLSCGRAAGGKMSDLWRDPMPTQRCEHSTSYPAAVRAGIALITELKHRGGRAGGFSNITSIVVCEFIHCIVHMAYCSWLENTTDDYRVFLFDILWYSLRGREEKTERWRPVNKLVMEVFVESRLWILWKYITFWVRGACE